MSAEATADGAPVPGPTLTLPRVLLGTLIGCLSGFAPALAVAPGLYVSLVALLVLLRAPLLVVVGLAVVTKLLSLVLGPAALLLGELLLDGPTGALFAKAINAPFLALFGLEYYAVTGGYALAVVLAVVATVLILRGRGEGGGRRRLLLRPVGVLVVALLVGAVWLLQSSAAESVVTAEAKKGLAKLNGATVDLSGVDLDLTAGRLGIEDLAMANPRALDTDLFHGLELSADIGNADLLRKRLHVQSLVVRKAESGSERGVPGVLVGAPAEVEPEPPGTGEWSVEDVLKDWEVWRDRLGQVREWLEKLGGGEEGAEAPVEDLPPALRKADHLIEGAPSLLVSEVRVEDLALAWLPDEAFDLSATNLSSAPGLVDGAMAISFGTRSDLFGAELALPKGASPGKVAFHLRGLEVDALAGMLDLGEGSVLRGGTVDLSLDGPWMDGRAGYLDLPLDITLRGVELGLGGAGTFPLSELVVPVHVRGPLDGLALRLDHDALISALRDAGAAELAKLVDAEKERLLAEGMAELQDVVDAELTGQLEGLLGTDLDLDVTDLDATRAELEAAATAKLEEEEARLKADLAVRVQAALDGAPDLGGYLTAEELEAFRAELTADLEADPAADPVALVQSELTDLAAAKLQAELVAQARTVVAGTPKLAEYLTEEELATFTEDVVTALQGQVAADPATDTKASATRLVQDKLVELGKQKLEERGKDELKKGLEKLFGGG